MKRNNILKAVALILLASVLIVSCEGWSAADNIITQSASVTENYYKVYVYAGDAGDTLAAELSLSTIPKAAIVVTPSHTSGYTFAGWYCDETGALFDSWDTTLTSNLTLHATWVLTSDNFATAFASGGYYALTEDVTVTGYDSSSNSTYTKVVAYDLTVDLNGYTLNVTTGNTAGGTVARFADIQSGANVTFSNGTMNIKCGETSNAARYETTLIILNTGTLNLDSVTLNVTGASAIYPQKASDVNITDSTVAVVDGCYALATNNADSGTEAGVYTIENSVISAVGPAEKGYDSETVVINRDAATDGSSDNTTLYIKNSVITGSRQALVVRGGKAEISNSTLKTDGLFDPTYAESSSYQTYSIRDTVWADNPRVIHATVTLGCNANTTGTSSIPYTADTDVTFSNVTFENKARWTIGVGTAADASSANVTTPKVYITIDSDQESLITTTCVDSNTVYVNGTSWGAYKNYYGNANVKDSSDPSDTTTT